MPFQKKLHNILYIEDDAGLARLLQKKLERSGLKIDLCFTGEEGLEIIQKAKHDLILLDRHLPGISGLDILAHLHPTDDYPPIILLTASGDEKVALQALELGAADYAVKDAGQFYFDLLPAIMQAAYVKHRLMLENIIQKQELEAARQKADAANQAKSEFLANMSHEIRTPLNVVIGVANLLTPDELTEKQNEMVELLRSSANLLLKLINELLDLSKVEAGQFELETIPFVFSNILRDLHNMFQTQANEKNLQLVFEDKTSGQKLEGDPTRIQQVLINLIANAIKFTTKGDIKVHAFFNDRNVLVVQVKDSGIGIPPEKIESIFGKFIQADQSITRQYGGSGLGLAIGRSLVELMGGYIHVQSETGEGSTFTIELPLARLPETESVQSNPKKPDSVSSKAEATILVVGDSPPNIFVMEMILGKWGYAIDIATSGETALQKIKDRVDANPYHAILMDIQMSHMDGYETTRAVRNLEKNENQKNYIIGLTAHALAGDREKCMDAGMDDYMTKPIQFDILERKLLKTK